MTLAITLKLSGGFLTARKLNASRLDALRMLSSKSIMATVGFVASSLGRKNEKGWNSPDARPSANPESSVSSICGARLPRIAVAKGTTGMPLGDSATIFRV